MNIIDLLALTGMPYALPASPSGEFTAFDREWAWSPEIERADNAGWDYHREHSD